MDFTNSEAKYLKIAAPMVRYSKLPFRLLVRKYGCDAAFTPMIIANSFVQSEKARAVDFSTNELDRPLIVQFASNNATEFAAATEIVRNVSDGVDLNCGCPQRWAMKENLGASLLKTPETVYDIIQTARRLIDNNDFSISIKIRILSDLKYTIELARRAERCGLTFITVHGRTPKQRKEPVNFESIREVKNSVHIPVIANGDIFSLEDVNRVHNLTSVNGFMSARGLLKNPCLYNGQSKTSNDCIQDFIDYSLNFGLPHTIFHHHLMDMTKSRMNKENKKKFHSLQSLPEILAFLRQLNFIDQ